MSSHSSTDRIFALFPDVESAERGIEECRRLGVRDEDMAIAKPRGEIVREVGGGVREIGKQDFLSSLFSAGHDIYRGLKDLGFSDEDARRYEDMVDQGNVLLSIRCGADCDRLQPALGQYRVFDTSGSLDWSRYRGGAVGERQAMPIREERLIPHKEEPRLEKKGEVRDEDIREENLRSEQGREV